MGFFDLFTGSGHARAEKAGRGLAGQYYDENIATLGQGYDRARDELKHGRDAAIHTLEGGRDAAGNVLRSGYGQARTDIDAGTAAALDQLMGAREAFGSAGDRYAGVEGIGSRLDPALEAVLDAAGLRGEEGLMRAQDAFNQSLNYNTEIDLGLEAINRAAAARGGGTVVGGNLDRDAQMFGQQIAQQKTGQHYDRLLGLADRGIDATGTAAAGRAAADRDMGQTYVTGAGVEERGGTNRAALSQTEADRIADLTASTSGAAAGLQSSTADRLAQLATGEALTDIDLTRELRDLYTRSLKDEATARSAGSRNLLSAGLKGADLLASVFGGF